MNLDINSKYKIQYNFIQFYYSEKILKIKICGDFIKFFIILFYFFNFSFSYVKIINSKYKYI
jgi:hypothetical protein